MKAIGHILRYCDHHGYIFLHFLDCAPHLSSALRIAVHNTCVKNVRPVPSKTLMDGLHFILFSILKTEALLRMNRAFLHLVVYVKVL
jgi:hypothetical protein